MLNASALLAATWFSESNRAFITTVASMANNMGSVIGALFPTFFITAGADPDTAKSEIQGQYLYQAIIASVILVPNFLFQRTKPPKPPSASAAVESYPFLEGLKAMLKNR